MAAIPWHFAAREIKRRQRLLLRKHWWRLLPVAAVLGLLAGALAITFPSLSVPLWLTVTIALVAALGAASPQIDGTYHLVSGIEAERWTSKELRRLLGREWKVVDWIAFEHHDVDHVMVGPGGVFAIETKYTDSNVDLDTGRGQRKAGEWATQAFDNARSTRLLLQSYGHKVSVTPLVVVWGADVVGAPIVMDGIEIRHGRDIRKDSATWPDLPARLSTAQADEVARALSDFRKMRIGYERTRHRPAG